MANELTVFIGGREAIPVRAIPYITGWASSPLAVARQLGRNDGAPFNDTLPNTFAYRLVNGVPVKVLPKQWDTYVAQLHALEAEIRTRHSSEDTGYAEWLATSVAKIPAGVFVWFDEYIADKPFGRRTLGSQRDGELEMVAAPLFDAGQRATVFEELESFRAQELDWNAWCAGGKTARAWQACLLSLEIDPDGINQKNITKKINDPKEVTYNIGNQHAQRDHAPAPDVCKEFSKRLKKLLDAMLRDDYFPVISLHHDDPKQDEVHLDRFAAWCLLEKLQIPPPLSALGSAFGVKRLQAEAAAREKEDALATVEESLGIVALWDCDNVPFEKAAKVLCGLNPDKLPDEPNEKNWKYEDYPQDGLDLPITLEDYQHLYNAFNAQVHTSSDRTMAYWLALAKKKGLRYHGWIDLWMEARGIVTASADSKPQAGANANPAAKSALSGHSSTCAIFRAMQNLTSDELSIAFVGDKSDSGLGANNLLEISARGVSKRVAIAELNLVNRIQGNLNGEGATLLGMAGKKIPLHSSANSQKIKRLRKVFKVNLGVTGDPFEKYRRGVGWMPLFKITDKRGAADDRAKREAERRTESYEQLMETKGVSGDELCNNDVDAADTWLKNNDPCASA